MDVGYGPPAYLPLGMGASVLSGEQLWPIDILTNRYVVVCPETWNLITCVAIGLA